MPGGTGEFDRHGLTTVTVEQPDRRSCVVGGPLIAPFHQRHERGEEVVALIGQSVFVAAPCPLILVGHSLQNPVHQKRFQPLGKKVACTSQCGVEVVEAPHPVERLAQDQECPLFADDAEGACDRTVARAVAEPVCVQIGMISRLTIKTQRLRFRK